MADAYMWAKRQGQRDYGTAEEARREERFAQQARKPTEGEHDSKGGRAKDVSPEDVYDAVEHEQAGHRQSDVGQVDSAKKSQQRARHSRKRCQ
jgi:hypothetical protein